MAYRILQLAILLGVVLTPAAATAQSAQADVARAPRIALAHPMMAQARMAGYRLVDSGDAALAQTRVAARIASDSTPPKSSWKRGALIGGTALWIATGVLVGGACMASIDSSSANGVCGEVGLAAGLLGGLVGAGIGAIIGSAIPRRMPPDTAKAGAGAG